MQIFGPYRVAAPQATQGNQRIHDAKPSGASNQAQKTRPAAPVDQLDLSTSVGQTRGIADSSAIAGGGEIRLERVAEIRRAIADGSYETPEKLGVALNRMLDDLA